jgi:hypothetical protein
MPFGGRPAAAAGPPGSQQQRPSAQTRNPAAAAAAAAGGGGHMHNLLAGSQPDCDPELQEDEYEGDSWLTLDESDEEEERESSVRMSKC